MVLRDRCLFTPLFAVEPFFSKLGLKKTTSESEVAINFQLYICGTLGIVSKWSSCRALSIY